MFNAQQLSDIAHSLKARSAGQDIAVAEDGQTAGAIYYSKRAPSVKEPYSAAVKLIQIGKNKKWKFANGMVSTAGLTEMCKGMAGIASANLSFAVAASTTPVALPGTTAPKVAHTPVTKITEAEEGVWEERDKDLALFKVPDIASPNVDITKDLRTEDHTGFHTIHRIYMMAAYALVSSRKFGTSSVPGGKNIGVLLVNPNGKIIGCGVNTNRDNGTFHAEVNCLQSYYKYNRNGYAGFPLHSRLYSTLEPCQMCAGMIWESAADPARFLVYYGMVDPAQLAESTKLSRTEQERLLSHWQEISYRTDKKSQVVRPITNPTEEKKREGPKAIKVYAREESSGPNAYQLIYTDYAAYLEQQKGTSTLSAADFMTGTKSDQTIPQSIMKVNASLLRKHAKYVSNPEKKTLNPNVGKVVLHVHEFLKQKGIAGF
jgi:tRNA(Arg) A34 adenosine deaminase TadA